MRTLPLLACALALALLAAPVRAGCTTDFTAALVAMAPEEVAVPGEDVSAAMGALADGMEQGYVALHAGAEDGDIALAAGSGALFGMVAAFFNGVLGWTPSLLVGPGSPPPTPGSPGAALNAFGTAAASGIQGGAGLGAGIADGASAAAGHVAQAGEQWYGASSGAFGAVAAYRWCVV